MESLLADLEDAESRVQKDQLTVSWAHPQVGPYGEALVATVSGSELARLYDTHQNRLFARNVRLFLGERKGSVNKGIVDTLEDREEQGNFWAYNNGVTIVCQAYKYRPRKRELELRNFSIVNGCQTTVCLHKAKGALTSGVEVLLKIIGPPASVIDRIIEFTNSQSPIRSWDIKSQDKVQRRLREELGSLAVPFFYAIRRGEFESLSRPDKRKFRERGQKHVVEFDTVAQYLGAFRGRSYFAYKFKTRLFEDLYRDVFPENMPAETILFAWQLGELGRQVVKAAVAEAAGDDDQKETLRILRKGCRVYLIAVTEYLLRRRNGETYLTKLADGKLGDLCVKPK